MRTILTAVKHWTVIHRVDTIEWEPGWDLEDSSWARDSFYSLGSDRRDLSITFSLILLGKI